MVKTKEEYAAQGKKNRRDGGIFERKVRDDLRQKGFIVDHFTNQVDLDKKELITAKSNQWNARTTGFPDFVAFKHNDEGSYHLMFVECKCNGKLSVTEKLKMNFFLKKEHSCFIAHKDDTGKKIIYREFVEYKKPVKIRRENTAN